MENRRKFIKKTATIAALSLVADWASAIPESDKWGDILPQRQLIRNGEKVTSFLSRRLSFGIDRKSKRS